MTNPLTLDWIISTLKKSGINSKQIVIDRLEQANIYEINDLYKSVDDKREQIVDEFIKGCSFGELGTVPLSDETKKKFNLDPRD